MFKRILNDGDLLEIARWNTPTIYNGWEAVTRKNHMDCRCNWVDVHDYTPHIKSAVGYAVTVEYRCDSEEYQASHPDNIKEWFAFLASIPGPKVVMCKDLNYPEIRGATTGELMSSVYKNLGCVGVVTDGAVRDVDESNASGFKLLGTRLMVGHGYACPVRWGHDIELLGTTVHTGDLVHLDKYGFICLDEEEQANILEAARRLDSNECQSVISTMYGCVQNEAALKANLEAVKAQLDKQAALNNDVRRDLSPKYVHGESAPTVL